MRKSLRIIAVCGSVGVGLGGCLPQESRRPEMIEVPMYMACKEPAPLIVEVPKPLPMPCQLKEADERAAGKTALTRAGGTTGKARAKVGVAQANEAARQRPEQNKFMNSVQVYQYTAGGLYQVVAGVTNATAILLQPGETLGKYVYGDKERWEIEELETGSPEGKRAGLAVKCQWPDTTTNLSIPTNKRLYLVELTCAERLYHAAVSWEYPGDRKMGVGLPVAPVEAPPVVQGVTEGGPERRNYAYTIALKKGKEAPAWMPTAVYDTAHGGGQVKTVIEFPLDLTQGEAPTLYTRTAENKQAVVNFRVLGQGTIYQLDGHYDAMELVLGLGEKTATVVSITRNTPQS